jgi:hypothetical protein
MDPRIRIRIHPKMSWIRNTGCNIRGRDSASRKDYLRTIIFPKTFAEITYIAVARIIFKKQQAWAAVFSVCSAGVTTATPSELSGGTLAYFLIRETFR